jgi:hypothetical protein
MRSPELGILAMCLALSSAGWVCNQSDACSDRLTCATTVADVCCPPGEPYLCDGECSATSCAGAVACQYPGETDSGACQLASLSATIETATCGARTSDGSGDMYTITATGTMGGCGSAALAFGASEHEITTSSVECGTWMHDVMNRCIPNPSPSSSTWTMSALLHAPAGTAVGTTISVELQALDTPALAAHTVHCE